MDKERLRSMQGELLAAKTYFWASVGLALASSGAVLSSLPIIYFEIIPQWAEITIASFGVLNAPGSIVNASKSRNWIRQGEQFASQFEEALKNQSHD